MDGGREGEGEEMKDIPTMIKSNDFPATSWMVAVIVAMYSSQ